MRPSPAAPGTAVVPTPAGGSAASTAPFPDPFAYTPERADAMAARAATGAAHPLYAFSPGGVIATARRTARWRPQIEQAAADAGVDPDRLEGLIFLESAGRPDAITANGIEGAVGLSQILAETGQNLLGLDVDVTASQRLTRQITRATRRGRAARIRDLEAQRRVVDERFDPAKALAGTVRYLTLARQRFGREDLAFVSYHMGIGNLEGVLRAFSGQNGGRIARVVADAELDWPRVYFDSTPTRHRRAQRRLASFGDDSSNYFWKVEAAQAIMRRWRRDRDGLARVAALQASKGSSEEVLHPPDSTPRFETPEALKAAWDRDELIPMPNDPAATGLVLDRRMGELSGDLRQPASLYRGLRPPALALALYIGAHVRASDGGGALTVTSTVRDQRYQDQLVSRNGEATRGYSLHTTGWAFDVLRAYRSGRQARALQWQLDRLSVLGVIAWVREPAAIHITVGDSAEAVLPLLDRLQ